MAVYSFADVACALNGPAGSVRLGAGAGVDEGGITVEPVEDSNVMTAGADGEIIHSHIASTASTVTVRLLKTSLANAQLANLHKAERASRLVYGRSNITISDPVRGDFIVLREVAFGRAPSLTYAKEAGMNEWVFHAGKTEMTLGVGTPEI